MGGKSYNQQVLLEIIGKGVPPQPSTLSSLNRSSGFNIQKD